MLTHKTFTMNNSYFIFDNFNALLLSSIMTILYSCLEIELLGFTMASILILLVFISVDFLTGVSYSLLTGDRINSKKGRETLYKIISYTMTLLLFTVIQLFIKEDSVSGFVDFSLSLIKHFIFSLMLLWEFHSVGENIELITGSKPRIFYFVEVTILLFEKKLIHWIKSILSINEKKKKPSIEESKEDISELKV